MDNFNNEKEIAAIAALDYVKDGMILGVGSGSTVIYFIEALGERVKKGMKITAVPTSSETKVLCKKNGITVWEDNVAPLSIDLTVDGADEFDSDLNLIKGGGGCLLLEKIVAVASQKLLIIVDSRKQVSNLGKTFLLPVEVIPYGKNYVESKMKELKIDSVLRLDKNSEPFLTDKNNYILDCKTGSILNPKQLCQNIKNIVGVVESGIFADMADIVLMGKNEKVTTFYKRSEIVPEEVQNSTMEKIFEKLKTSKEKGEIPVVELDLDMTTFSPSARAKMALIEVANQYNIEEFRNPIFDILPGYTREAWINFISRNQFPKRYPELAWLGNKDGVGGKSVYSVFHTKFWETELLKTDSLTNGLAGINGFVEKVKKYGGKVVLISGRWKEEQIAPTKVILKDHGLGDIPLLIGNKGHDSKVPIGDAEIKALFQVEIRKNYGVPAVIIDDRLANRKAVCDANLGNDMLSVGISIPGFTYDEEITSVDLKISTFNVDLQTK